MLHVFDWEREMTGWCIHTQHTLILTDTSHIDLWMINNVQNDSWCTVALMTCFPSVVQWLFMNHVQVTSQHSRRVNIRLILSYKSLLHPVLDFLVFWIIVVLHGVWFLMDVIYCSFFFSLLRSTEVFCIPRMVKGLGLAAAGCRITSDGWRSFTHGLNVSGQTLSRWALTCSTVTLSNI